MVPWSPHAGFSSHALCGLQHATGMAAITVERLKRERDDESAEEQARPHRQRHPREPSGTSNRGCFAFVYNVLELPIAAGVLFPTFGILPSPMLAAAAMSLGSVSVIANALRLRRLHL